MPKPKSRGNGEGSVYQLPSGKWKIEVTLGYDEKGKHVRTKQGFRTKKEALASLPILKQGSALDIRTPLSAVYEQWTKEHALRVSKQTMDCYKAGWGHLASVAYRPIASLRTADWQSCMDSCPTGVRTKQNMKALGSLLYKYAIREDICQKNYVQFVYIPPVEEKEKQFFSDIEIEKIRQAVGIVPAADSIYCLIYTGFRIGEFLDLHVSDYNSDEKILVGGKKTEAGRNRVVPVSPKILPIIEEWTNRAPDTHLFIGSSGQGIKQNTYRRVYYYPALEAIGVRPLTPHATRHTFATLMKRVSASDMDKQKLIGHASIEMTAHYTHANYDDLRLITDRI